MSSTVRVETLRVVSHDLDVDRLEQIILDAMKSQFPRAPSGSTGTVTWDVSSGGFLRGARVVFAGRTAEEGEPFPCEHCTPLDSGGWAPCERHSL